MSSFSRERAHSLENEQQIAAERSKTTPNQCRTQLNDPKSIHNAHSLEHELILSSMSSFSRVWAHSLENEPQIDAERSNLAQSKCRTQQFGPESMQNAAKRHHIDAERCKIDPNRWRTQQINRKSLQNAANWPRSIAERSFSREWAHSLEKELIL